MTPPPSLLTSYLPALILASNTLLEHCSQDPTAYGISTAFLESSSQLENALVAYCGVVGDIFATKRTKRKLVRSRRGSAAIDESKRSSPSANGHASLGFSRRGFGYPSSPPTSFFAFSDKRKTMPPMSESSLDFSRRFSTEEAPSPPPAPLHVEIESSQDHKTAPRRSFSLFRRKTSSQTNPPAPTSPKLRKPSWRRFRSSSKSSIQAPTYSNEVIESPRHINQMPPRPTRPLPPVPQESPPISDSAEPEKSTSTLRRHNRSASLQEAHMSSAEPPSSMAWNTPNPIRRGGASLDMNHVIGSFETSTYSSHNLFGEERRERIPTVRDLAILPTQRVRRYVLLFKGS